MHLRSDESVSSSTPALPSDDGGAGALDTWVRRAQEGDGEAFGRLYAHHAPMLHALLLASVQPADADDLLQEVFLSAWKGVGGLRSTEHVGAWLSVIARNAARRFHSRAKPRPEPIPEMLVDRAAQEGSRVAEGGELLELIRGLSETYREALLMRLVEGMSGPEIAAATGLGQESVRTHLSRGMKQLRARLRQRGWQ